MKEKGGGGGGGGGSYLKNEGKMSGDNNDSLELETHQRNEGKWGGVATSRMKER